MAHWSVAARQNRSTSELIRQLQSGGYWVILISTSEVSGRLEWPADAGIDPTRLTIIRRPNIGYDFGSWAVGLDRYSHLLATDNVLVLNDSLVGPFDDIGHILTHFEASQADVWGLTESDQIGSHLQSFFRGFRFGTLREPALRRFWRDIRVREEKVEIIRDYELDFSNVLRRNCYTVDAYLHHRYVVADGKNPMVYGWRGVLDAGVPFVKREIVRDATVAPDGDQVVAEVERRYGVAIDEWL